MKYNRTTVTAALPYANGPVHIGHLAGCYLPADIYVRFLRLQQKDVLFICGSDEHGVPITIKAKKEGISPQQVVDKYHAMMKESFRQFGISFDIYERTSSPLHHATASEFFSNLYEKGVFREEITEQYYDEEARQFLADRYITGTCPHCSNEHAYGDQCERCGSSLNPTDLINPHSTLSGSTPVLRKTKNWFLPLDAMQPAIADYLESHKDWKSNVYGQCKSWLQAGLQPRAMTRDLDWGVKVPLPGCEGKVLYVWFDAPIGYISATKAFFSPEHKVVNTRAANGSWEQYWQAPDTRLIHFIGKDNIVFHCIIFPAMLMAAGNYILPENVPANEFLNLEGDKISTSRNWAVWLHEYLEDFEGKQDVLRYMLCSNMPETKDNDFTWKDFQARNNNELVAIFGNFVNRTLVLTRKYFNGVVPTAGKLEPADQECLELLNEAPVRIASCLEKFKFREALSEFMNIARAGNKYLADHEPWKLWGKNNDRVQTILYVSLQLTAKLSTLGEPFLPFASARLRLMLNIELSSWFNSEWPLKSGHSTNEPELLFQKIEDAEIEQQISKLNHRKNQMMKNTLKPAGQKPETSFEEFNKMDIRIATILEAEKVPKTDKLLKLKLDTGMDQRTVVSGIAAYYQPEEIIGKQVCLLANLAPRKIKGIESKGMILMAENLSGQLCFVLPSQLTDNGSTVK